MKLKKIEKQKSSFLSIGLVCASALVLMSFEYATFDVQSSMVAENNHPIEDELLETFDEVEVYVPPTPVPKQVSNEDIDVTPEPIPVPVPEPEPLPEPFPDPGPIVDPIIVPPTVGIKEPIIDPVFDVVETMPEFPGGMQALYDYLGENIKYPEISKDMGREGKVFVKFTIEKDGSISSTQVMKGVDKYIDKEAVKVVNNMPKWKPGEQLNKKVRVNFVLPLNFVLAD